MQSEDLIGDLMDGLRSQLPGADDGIVLYVMRDTVRELCRRSRVWITERDIPALRNIGALRLSTVTGFGDPVFIEAVSFRGQRLRYDDVDHGTEKPKEGVPTTWSWAPPDRILLNPILADPAPSDMFHVRAVVQPRLGDDALQTLSHVPAHIFSMHGDLVKEGVLGKLYSMAGKPWSSGVLAAVHAKNFRVGAANALIGVRNAMGADHSPRWRFPNPAAWRRP